MPSFLYLSLAGAVLGLLAVGLAGLLVSRNLIRILIALQIMLKAAVIALASAGGASGQINLGQSLAVTAIAADTMVSVVGLALAVRVWRHYGTLDVSVLSRLRG